MKQGPRIQFQLERAFPLFTDTNHELLRGLAALPIERIPDCPPNNEYGPVINPSAQAILKQNPAGASMHLAMRHITKPLSHIHHDDSDAFYKAYNISEADRTQAEPFTFNYGFNDLGFPWLFAAGAANAIADFLVDEGVLTQEQKDDFTLHDWASMIGSPWFSRTMHLVAATSGEVYRSFGHHIKHYARGALAGQLAEARVIQPGDPLFKYEYDPAPEQAEGDETYCVTVEPTAIVMDGLTARLRRADSIGCPVARHTVVLPTDVVRTDPHIRNLVNGGMLQVRRLRTNPGKVRVTQEQSAIDRTLSLFAWQLGQYASRYGTPYWVVQPGERQAHAIHR